MPKYQLYTVAELPSFEVLRGYVGRSDSVCISVAGSGGLFAFDPFDTTSADDGADTIVGNDGRRWKRITPSTDGLYDAIEEAETVMQGYVDATAADRVQTGADAAAAELAKIAAEAAMDGAFTAGNMKADTTEGLADTSDGDYFAAVSIYGGAYDIWLNDGGTAVFVRTASTADQATATRAAHQRADADGKMSSYVEPATGITRFPHVRTKKINGRHVQGLLSGVAFGGGTFGFDDFHVDNLGQSLGNSHVGGTDLSVEPMSWAYAYLRMAYNPDPTDFKTLVATDPDITGTDARGYTGENPMFGMAHFFRELILKENGIDIAQCGIQFGTCNNAEGAQGVGHFTKTNLTADNPYGHWYQQISARKTYAEANGRRLWVPASLFTQGENEWNFSNGYTTWYNAALAQAQNRRSDVTALGLATQDLEHRYLIYQTSTRQPGLSDYGPTRAQYDLSVAEPDLVTLTTPNYFLDFSGDATGIHCVARDSHWLGAYAALALKRLFIDRVEWRTPVATPLIIGDSVILEYAYVRKPPFVIDTDWIPEQPNYGFRVKDGDGDEVTIDSVELAGPTGIRLNLASTPTTGWQIDYAQTPTSNRTDFFTGGCGNIRDSNGDFCVNDFINRPMHNWLPCHRIIL